IKNVHSSVASGRAVYVNSDNKIGTLVSSRRFKDQIQPMDKVSEAILALKPVTFHYKKEIEPNGSIMFGLIAEEVEQVDHDLLVFVDCQFGLEEGKMKGSTKPRRMDEPFYS